MTQLSETQKIKNRYGFGLGTLGRDAVYTMISMYLMFYLTDILEVPTSIMGTVTVIIMLTRIFDAVNDPFMGVLVDNTHSRFGKFKPWILGGALLSSLFTVLMFTDLKLTGTSFVIVFMSSYLLWEISFTANDIAFWGMLPALSRSQKERERIGGIARICANLGMFSMVVGIVPLTNLIGAKVGSMTKAYTYLAIGTVGVMLVFQLIMLLLVKEEHIVSEKQVQTSIKDMITVIFKNDQLLWVTVSMTLFMFGYGLTTSLGIYYFKYIYGDENMYAMFALVLGISQITALILFPKISQYFNRQSLYTYATILVVLGYLIFFFAPTTTMVVIGIAGVLMFLGQACIQLLMLMFITDTVEYGQWLFGRRNESVTLSLQAFINKLGGALASGMVGFTLVLTGVKAAAGPSDLTAQGIITFKLIMMLFPLLLIVIGYVVYRKKYVIDERFYRRMLKEIAAKEQEDD